MGKKRDPRSRGEGAYAGLRHIALEAVTSGSVTPSGRHALVGGVVVDIPAKGGYVTIVSLADDTTSMYTSVGGGTLGAGGHAHVAAATHALIDAAESQLGLFAPGGSDDLPPPGMARFHVLGFAGSAALDVPEDAFWGKVPHQLMPTIAATQAVVSALRTSDPAGA